MYIVYVSMSLSSAYGHIRWGDEKPAREATNLMTTGSGGWLVSVGSIKKSPRKQIWLVTSDDEIPN
jgi:hypothetical protein